MDLRKCGRVEVKYVHSVSLPNLNGACGVQLCTESLRVRVSDGLVIGTVGLYVLAKRGERRRLLKPKEMRRTVTIRCPEPRHRHASRKMVSQDRRPDTLATRRIMRVPHGVQRRDVAQVIDVPVQRAVGPCVSPNASPNPTGPEGATHVDVQPGPDRQHTQGADLNCGFFLTAQAKCVRPILCSHRIGRSQNKIPALSMKARPRTVSSLLEYAGVMS